MPDQAYYPILSVDETSPRFSYHSDDTSPERLKLGAKQIRIVDEEIENSKARDAALSALKDAEVVCFLGFGYERANLEKLQIENLREKRFYGTFFGLPTGQRAAIRRYFESRGCTIDLRDEDVLRFFKNTDLIYD